MVNDLRIGSGLDVHPFAPDDAARPLVLGGVTVAATGGLEGHSDADVVAHAVADALLGAVAAGDLGSRFGVDDPALADGDSMALLSQVVRDLADAGWRPVNVDLTVVAQRPRLAPHRDAMRSALAHAVTVPAESVSVKFTTTDGLGAVGRGEGIAAWATVLVRLK